MVLAWSNKTLRHCNLKQVVIVVECYSSFICHRDFKLHLKLEMPSVERSICPRATSQWTNCFYNYGRIHCACTKRPYIHFRFKMWRHHRVPPPRFRLRRGNSAIRPWIRVILRTFHCACAKRPYLTFRSKIWRHHRVSRPRFPARRENLGDLRTFKADIGLGLLNICMGFQDLLAKICGFGNKIEEGVVRLYCDIDH